MIEKISLCHGCAGDVQCREKINELIDAHNNNYGGIRKCPDTALDTKQEKCPEYSEVEKNIIKWWREGNITLHHNSNYKGAIIGTGTMGEGKE